MHFTENGSLGLLSFNGSILNTSPAPSQSELVINGGVTLIKSLD